jgi:hypothetical protein
MLQGADEDNGSALTYPIAPNRIESVFGRRFETAAAPRSACACVLRACGCVPARLRTSVHVRVCGCGQKEGGKGGWWW